MMEYHEIEGCVDIKSETLDIKKEEDDCDGSGINDLSLINSSVTPSDHIEIKPFVDESFTNLETKQTTIKSGPWQVTKYPYNNLQSRLIMQ
ncbi:hypothetical protein NQ318_022215 [Aromia moschata]|uniref:Uncharacterized protein n=1 Tax=Aromia moschata TaxID=1265417 RepID=A0AAV8XB38_9CUCU|nr:hypothetical protein NQ318_022215 [Aromia moschata]